MSTQPATVFLLHYLGGSRRSWDGVVSRLRPRLHCAAPDLPGFGDDAAVAGYSVTAMADAVCQMVRAASPVTWLLVGHSMGAKVAAVVARRAEDGEAGLAGLRGVVAVAGSPPSPEPMQASQRDEMLTWFAGNAAQSREQATRFVGRNISAALPGPLHSQAVADAARSHPAAWRAWLEHGSQEDWSARVGVLRTPALLVAGADDTPLGPDGQRRYALPHYAQARLICLQGAKHLLPLERPDDLADLILGHAA